MRNNAFTLAEVLLTLAIIGVVAALTIPAVITKVTQDQYVVALKKAFNTLKGVQRESEQDNGSMDAWTWTNNSATDFNQYFKPYMDILKDCGATTDDGCFASSYNYLNGTTYINPNTTTYAKVVTSDGISFGYAANSVGIKKGTILVDVNGRKMPNILGRDLFIFWTFPTLGGIKPIGTYNESGDRLTSENVDNSCKTTGLYCAAKVLAEGQMDY